jgi:hypothetical protein
MCSCLFLWSASFVYALTDSYLSQGDLSSSFSPAHEPDTGATLEAHENIESEAVRTVYSRCLYPLLSFSLNLSIYQSINLHVSASLSLTIHPAAMACSRFVKLSNLLVCRIAFSRRKTMRMNRMQPLPQRLLPGPLWVENGRRVPNRLLVVFGKHPAAIVI